MKTKNFVAEFFGLYYLKKKFLINTARKNGKGSRKDDEIVKSISLTSLFIYLN